MKKNIIKIPLKGLNREQWLAERQNGIGGSDVGAIYGIDRYKPGIKLFHQKIGWFLTDESDNMAAYAGRVGEEHVYGQFWRYLDPEDVQHETLLHNANNENVIREAQRINFMLKNPDFPWLLANIDYRINKYKDRGNGILELKMPRSSHWNSYASNIPPAYILQLTHYMGVTGYDWGEIFAVKDGNYPELFTFEFKQSLFDGILERTEDFWNRVLKSREIVNNKKIPERGEVNASSGV